MPAHLVVLAIAAIFFLVPLQTIAAEMSLANQSQQPDLPNALNEVPFFDDLPFQQQRQILREEVPQDSENSFAPHIPSRQYNLLIR